MGTYEKINSIYNASRLLRTFTHERPVQRVTDIANQLNLPKSTVSRLVQNLVAEEFLEKDKNSSRYMLGHACFTLGGIYATSTQIFKEVTPVLTTIAYETSESVYIAVLKNYNVVYVNKSLGPYYSETVSEIGSEQPAYLTSSGRVLLAAKNETYINEMFRQLNLETNPTMNLKTFKQELAKIAKDKYAVSKGLLKKDNYSIAVPVYDGNGAVVCALTLIAPISRMSDLKTKKFLEVLTEAAEEAGDRLAFGE